MKRKNNFDELETLENEDLQTCVTRCSDILKKREEVRQLEKTRAVQDQWFLFALARWKKVCQENKDILTNEYNSEYAKTLISKVIIDSEQKIDAAITITETGDCGDNAHDVADMCLQYALNDLEMSALMRKREVNLPFGSRIPCDGEDCWYGGHTDQLYRFKLLHEWRLFPDGLQYCDVCAQDYLHPECFKKVCLDDYIIPFANCLREVNLLPKEEDVQESDVEEARK